MRYLVVISIAVWALYSAPSATAQELSIEEALNLCMKIGNSGDRLECFEALARASAPVQSAKIEKNRPKANTATSAPSNVGSSAKADKTVAGLVVKTKKKRGGIFPFNRLKKSKQKYVFVKPGETSPSRAGRAAKPVKQVAYDAKVLRAWRNAVDDLYVALDNGEVWKHADPGHPRLPKPNAVIHMKPGMAGAWFMAFANRSPRIRVRQIK